VESLLLSAIGGCLGLVLALWTDRLLMALLPSDTISLQLSTTKDLRVLGFTAAVSLLTGILFGLVPALESISRIRLVESWAAERRSASVRDLWWLRCPLSYCCWWALVCLCAAWSRFSNQQPGFIQSGSQY
jgi:hypothetical protein